MKLYLIRHGQSEGNVDGALDTVPPGQPLTELGHRQAAELASRLGHEPLVAVYASRATRAQQTADALSAALELETQVIDGVQEVAAGRLEGRNNEEAINEYIGVVGSWASGDLSARMPAAESGDEVRARFLGAVNDIAAKHAETHPDGAVALVCHGALIRLGGEWLAENVHPDAIDSEFLPNTGIVRFETRPEGGWHCTLWGTLAM